MANARGTPGNLLPPAEPGNTRAGTHRAYSEAALAPRAAELLPTLLAAHPHLEEGRDGPAIARYAMTLARIERVYAWLGDRPDPVFTNAAKGEAHAIYDRLARWERQAEAAERELGLSPTSRARLGLDYLVAQAKADIRLDLTKLTLAELDFLEALHCAAADPDRPIQPNRRAIVPAHVLTKLDSRGPE